MNLTGPTPNKPSNITNPRDVLDEYADYILSGVNCVAIGTVVEFNPVTQTVQGTINYRRWDGANWTPYAAIMDAPVIILTGGLANLTFPIAPGDTCLFLFNDRPISGWFATGQVGPLPSFRMHSLNDGMCLVGVRSLLGAIKNYDMLHAMLSYGTTQVGVSATQVRIANVLTTLGAVLTAQIGNPKAPLGGLMPALQQFCTACAGSTDATLVSAAAALLLSLNTPVTGIAALTGGLLE